MRKKRTSLKDKIMKNVAAQKSAASSYGYLNLPKNISIFSADPGSRVWLDFMLYEVTDNNHPDRNDDIDLATIGSFWYRRPFKIHRNVGVNNDAIVCPTSIGKPCPICEYKAKRINEGADKEETDTMKISKRNLYCVIPKNNKKYDEVPHIWDISHYLFQNLLNDELEEDETFANFPEPEEGYTLKIRFDSKTIGSSQPFAEASRIDFEERDKQYDDSILDKIPKLDEALNILSYSAIKSMFFELENENENENVTEEEPEKSTVQRSRKRKVIDKKIETEEELKPEVEKRLSLAERRKIRQDKKKEPENKCPNNYKFGVDCDTYDECVDCELWDSCAEEQERLESEE